MGITGALGCSAGLTGALGCSVGLTGALGCSEGITGTLGCSAGLTVPWSEVCSARVTSLPITHSEEHASTPLPALHHHHHHHLMNE